MTTQITHVAVVYDGTTYSLAAPYRHHDVIRKIFDITGSGLAGPSTQGFLDNTGVFMTRSEAFELAAVNGQLLRAVDSSNYTGKQLFSEDIW